MVKLTATGKEKISKAIQKAESKTSGELAVVIAKKSYDYAIYELTFAVVCGLVTFLICMVEYNPIDEYIKSNFWIESSVITPAVIGFGSFLVIGIMYLVANLPFIDRLIVPNKIQEEKVKEKAQLSFLKQGVHITKDRTGVLIFISNLERRVEILADSGIAKIYSNDSWDKQLDKIITGITCGDFVTELCLVIEEIGTVLKDNFPIQKDDINEISDDVKEI